MPGLEGTMLGRYYLEQLLGRGGMSEVYLAYDELMKRNVAIKVVGSVHSDYILRFCREVEAIGALNHGHILTAFDYGEQEPWHYLVMTYMEQGTLSERLANGPLTLEEAGIILEQVASALQFAHDNGIIHRDIKASNILLGSDGLVYLADFGLSKALEGNDDITQTGALFGTPEYMAPELAEGPATASSDIMPWVCSSMRWSPGELLSLGRQPSLPTGSTFTRSQCLLQGSILLCHVQQNR